MAIRVPIAVAITTLEPDAAIVFLNAAFERTLGYTLDDIPTVAAWAIHAYPDATYRTAVFKVWNAAVARAIQAERYGGFGPYPAGRAVRTNAEADGALATYEQQVLLALEESENAFSDYCKRQQRLISLIRQSESSRAAADLAAIRYREGTVDFLVLLDAQRERLAAEDSQAQAEVDLYRGIVAIYKALGGGWKPDTVVATAK